ncbi:Crp/Fnr family transcriptional regulator [Shimia sp. SDUM112013]|uniref:Crp/Fnr family transcriptional regulator n=1 Tax=Shimia sp. SDUM112013 TaxID=3136160 RepID=UPI0032EB7531
MTKNIVLPAGKTLFGPGQECAGFVEVTRGSIRVSMTAPNGREIVLYRVKPGDVCLQTLSCLIEGSDYSAEGVVEADLEGRFVPKSAFWSRMEQDAAFRTDILSAVARRFGDYQRLVEEVALTGFDTRLARVLLRLQDEGGVVYMTHGELAAETASGRAFVSRRLAEFAHQGLVELSRGKVRICDSAGLQRISEEDR